MSETLAEKLKKITSISRSPAKNILQMSEIKLKPSSGASPTHHH